MFLEALKTLGGRLTPRMPSIPITVPPIEVKQLPADFAEDVFDNLKPRVAEAGNEILDFFRTGEGRKKLLGIFGVLVTVPLIAAGIHQGMGVASTWFKSRIAGAAQRELQKGFYSVIKPKDMPALSFDSIIGQFPAKEQLLSFMRKSETPYLNKALNAGDPRSNMNNVLLVGPPGTGKTQLARTLASNLHTMDPKKGTMFISADLEKLVQLEPGTGAKNVKKLEDLIRKSKSKRIVLFTDEIDGLGSRGKNIDQSQATTAFLKLIDGVKPFKDKEILVIGATNHPKNMDEALLNRFREIIPVSAPKPAELVQMYNLYFDQKYLKAAMDLDWSVITKESGGFTGRTVEQATAHLKNTLLDRIPKAEKLALDKKIQKLGPQKGLEGFDLTFTQQDLIEAIKAVQKPKYQTMA